VASDTLVHTLVLLDRYISSEILSASLHTIESTGAAAACFLISVKLREIYQPSVQDLSQIIGIEHESVLHSEAVVLQSLDWDICSVSGDLKRINLLFEMIGPDIVLQD
jgi:hypothetical protein